MKLSGLILAYILTGISLLLCQQVIANSLANQENKYEYAELNHVRYGLLNVSKWKSQITGILSEEINKLDLSKTSERELRGHLEILLNTLIDKLAKQIRKSNDDSPGGWVKQTFINLFVSLEDIKKGIPDYANAIIHEMKKAKTKRQVKKMLHEQLELYAKETYEPQNTEYLKRILQTTGSKDISGARLKVNQAISLRQNLIWRDSLLMIGLAVILFSLSGFSKQPLAPNRFVLLVVSLILLLIIGVTTPTIDMEAKVTQLSFMVMGYPIHFENQVLYFQSKSLLDVFKIMMEYKEIQMKFVGILLVLFSIVFPVLKIISSLVYYYNYRRARENVVVKFFVLKSGKWSMADVMVVAMFMAYIGFNGMIDGLFGQLRDAGGPELVMIATNGTSLQPGYYVFLTYTLLALFLAGFLNSKQLRRDTQEKIPLAPR
jgi:hypothetical protein